MYNSDTGFVYCYTGSVPPYQASILRTTNGGLNWISVMGSNTITLYDLCCVNRDTTFICGYNNILKSINCGSSWVPTSFSIYYPPDLKSIVFVNNSIGYSAGLSWNLNTGSSYPSIYKTTNCGINWTNQSYPKVGTGNQFNSIDFYDVNNGFAVSDSGYVFRTTNMGNTWIKQKKFQSKILNVCFPVPNNAYIGLLNGSVYSTTNGGWDIPSAPNLINPVYDSFYVSCTPQMRWQNILFNAPLYSLQISLDSNFNSTVLNINSIDTAGYNIPTNILFPDNLYYWRVNSRNPVYESPWSPVWKFRTNKPTAPLLISPPNNDTTVTALQLMDWTDVISASGYKLQISKDSLFTQIKVDSLLSPISQIPVPASKLYGNIYYFWRVCGLNINGAGNWSVFRKFKSPDYPLLFVPQNNDSGIVYNALFDWTDRPGAVSYRLQISADSLFTQLNCNYNIYGSQYYLNIFLQQNTFYFWRVNAGYSGNISSFWSEVRKFKSSSIYSGINKLEEIPTEYRLYSNFPNPFNPSTNIKFDIPKSSFVRISVFDVMGKEVTTLVNEQLQPGTYETDWNASAFSSGVYFYRLNAGNFSETKRMLLIK